MDTLYIVVKQYNNNKIKGINIKWIYKYLIYNDNKIDIIDTKWTYKYLMYNNQ